MGDQVYLFQLIIGWTCVGVFVCTAVITLLSIIGWLRIDTDIRNRLFTALIIEIISICLAVFVGLVQVNPAPVQQEIKQSAQAQETLQAIETPTTANATTDGPAPSQPTPAAAETAITPRVYIQISSEGQRAEAERAQSAIRQAGLLAPGIENIGKKAPSKNQLRYFVAGEAALAKQIAADLSAAGVEAPPILIKGFENADIRPHHFELWFAGN
jgi:hypothetical protein